jgi:hypothetical protein
MVWEVECDGETESSYFCLAMRMRGTSTKYTAPRTPQGVGSVTMSDRPRIGARIQPVAAEAEAMALMAEMRKAVG